MRKEKKIIVLSGGAGNQMFQYAFGRALELNKGCKVEYDITFYKSRNDRNFELGNLCVPVHKYAEHNILNILRLIFQRIPIVEWITGFHKECEEFVVDEDISKKEYFYYSGYWQNKTYFTDIRSVLIEEFQYSQKLSDKSQTLRDSISCNHSIAVHIRRGDYLLKKQKSVYCNLNKEYYREAISRARQILKDERAPIFVFSDDITYCEKEFYEYDNITFIKDNKEISPLADMALMQRAQCLIIANSTFSWWAAWLCDRENKIVIAPSNWFQDDVINKRAVNALLDDDWIII